MSQPTNHGKAWHDEEVQNLLKEVHKKLSIDQIAESHQRSRGGIRSKLRSLAADYYFYENRSIEEIMKFTGLAKDDIADAISKRQYDIDMKGKKQMKAPVQVLAKVESPKVELQKEEDILSVLKDIRSLLKDLVSEMKSSRNE